MSIDLPTDATRWRCAHCGNLTRFDVERRRHTQEFWHLDLSGQPGVEEVQLLSEEIVRVRCRWCGSDDAVAVVARPDLEGEPNLGGTP